MSAWNPLASPDATAEMVYPSMPDLASPHFYFHHTLHSALEVLAALGISGPRISIEMAGQGRPDWIMAQEPPAGSPLRPDVVVKLSVAGLGFFHYLPSGMWERSEEGEVGTQEIVTLFDDPFQKARHWIREGARVFDLNPANLAACMKWIGMFGFDPNDWPAAIWYELALLAPELHRLAGRAEGVCKVLKRLLGLDVMEIRTRPYKLEVSAPQVSRLGSRSSELGIDLILGNRVETVALWAIRLGPMTLERYNAMQSPENLRLLDQIMQLCVPLEQRYEFTWIVLDPARPPRLGFLEDNACLGVNSWMGPVAREDEDLEEEPEFLGSGTGGYRHVN